MGTQSIVTSAEAGVARSVAATTDTIDKTESKTRRKRDDRMVPPESIYVPRELDEKSRSECDARDQHHNAHVPLNVVL
jgi:hypothetical protein